MPLLRNKQKIAELRSKCPELVRVSSRAMPELIPHVSSPDEDRFGCPVGAVVFATSTQSDFYALSCRDGAVNYSRCWYDANKKAHRVFIFEKIKPVHYKHVVSSETFVPIVPKDDVFEGRFISGEWVSPDRVTPKRIEKGTKEDILKKTDARVFSIVDLDAFRRQYPIRELDRHMEMIPQAIHNLVQKGILKDENPPPLRGKFKGLINICKHLLNRQ